MNISHLFAAALATAFLTSSLALAGEPQANPDLPDGVTAGDWAQVQSLIAAQSHAIQAKGGGHVASNPGLQSTARFDGDSALIEVGDSDWRFGLALKSYGFTGHATSVDMPTFGTCVDGQELTYAWSEELSEWWINDSRGFEHGFNVWERPAGAAAESDRGPLTFTLDVLGTLTPEANGERTGLVLLNAEGSVALRYDGLFAEDANGAVLDSWLEVDGTTLRICVNEAGAAYPLLVDPIVSQAYLKASNTQMGTHFGTALSLSGNTLVVGAPFEESNATGVNGDQSDTSARGTGAAYVFIRSGGTWSQQAYLKASNSEMSDHFGLALALSGDTLAVTSEREGSSATGVNGDQSDNSAEQAGAAYVFVRSGGTWSQQAYLKASNTEARDSFGLSVAVSGDTVVVGAPEEDSSATGVNGDPSDNAAPGSGAAYVFVRSSGTWSQEAYLKGSNAEAGDAFGLSVAASGDTVVVGARWEDSALAGDDSDNSAAQAGAAYVFVRSGGTWSQQSYLKASNPEAEDEFGRSVALSGETLIVGAPFEDSSASGVNGDGSDNSALASGAAYVFVRSGGSWIQQAYLKASNTGASDRFGWAVALAGEALVVGAPVEDSGATGVNGDESGNSAPTSGAAYAFARSGGTWSQQAYLKASNTGAQDNFGFSVDISGDTVVAGARLEDSGATGVNGDGTDNSALVSGAAYVFAGLVSPGIGDLVCAGTPNSGGFGGTLSASGSSVVTNNALSLEIACCPAAVFGLVVTSSSNGGPIGTVSVGEGSLCIVNGQLGRFSALMTDQNGAATQALDLNAIPNSALGSTAALPGDTYYFQFWHRDVVGGTPTSNLTSAISVLFE